MARLVEALPSLTDPATTGAGPGHGDSDGCGRAAFGVAAHRGALLLTLRPIRGGAGRTPGGAGGPDRPTGPGDGLEFSFSYCDVFPETVNTPACVEAVRAAAEELGLTVVDLPEPARCSEDFGWYTKRRPGAFFFLGDGRTTRPLHSTTFDFPTRSSPPPATCSGPCSDPSLGQGPHPLQRARAGLSLPVPCLFLPNKPRFLAGLALGSLKVHPTIPTRNRRRRGPPAPAVPPSDFDLLFFSPLS